MDAEGNERWYTAVEGGAQQGPWQFRVVRAHLRLGVLNGDTLVWKEGMPDWLPAKEVAVFHRCLNKTSTRSGLELPGKHTAEALAKFTDDFHRMQQTDHIMPSFSSAIHHNNPPKLRGGDLFANRTPAPPAPAAATNALWSRAPPPPPHAADNAEWFYLAPGGAEVGPVSTAEMRRVLASGEAGNAPWVWSATAQPEWTPAENAPALRAAPPPPPAAAAAAAAAPGTTYWGAVTAPAAATTPAAAAAAASEARGLEAEADDLRLRLANALEKLEEREARVRFFKDRLRSTQDDLAIKEREVNVLQEMIKSAKERSDGGAPAPGQEQLGWDPATPAGPPRTPPLSSRSTRGRDARSATAFAADTRDGDVRWQLDALRRELESTRAPSPMPAPSDGVDARELAQTRRELEATRATLAEKERELVAARDALQGDLSWLVTPGAGA